MMDEAELSNLLRQSGLCEAYLGNDLIFLPDFIKNSFTEGFKRRVYAPEEVVYCEQFSNPGLRYASTFCAKEATYKAIKQYDSTIKLSWKKIVISRDSIAGKPQVLLPDEIQSRCSISLSITHDGDYVWSIALLQQRRKSSN